MQIPLPAKIRTEILDPVKIDPDPDRENDDAYVDRIYAHVEESIQDGVNRLVQTRRMPVLG